jgi:hypothetical protein
MKLLNVFSPRIITFSFSVGARRTLNKYKGRKTEVFLGFKQVAEKQTEAIPTDVQEDR